MRSRLLLVALAVAALTCATPATATELDTHPEVSAALAGLDGGYAVDYYQAYWPQFDMTLSVHPPGLRSVGTCTTGFFCAFNRTGMAGTRLSWGTCTTVTPTAGFVTASIANARGAGSTVQARYGTTVLASVTSDSWANVGGTVTNLRCLD